MRREGREDFSLFTRRHLGPVKGASQLGRDLVEFRGRDLEVTMRILKSQGGTSRFCRREFERPARDLADPQGSHELETRQSAQVIPVPIPERRILRILSDDRVLHNRVTKVVNYGGDGEDPAKPFVQTLLRNDLR